MNGNICPTCGKPVMTFGRFFREAEPYKVSLCGSCGVRLKRSGKVIPYLIGMLVLLAFLSAFLLIGMMHLGASFWTLWVVAVLWMLGWISLISFLSWRYIPWKIVE